MESTNKKTTRDYKEMLLLKGIGSELEKMAYPKVSNLKSMLDIIDLQIIKFILSQFMNIKRIRIKKLISSIMIVFN
jgi:hypothetical protein